MLGLQFAFATNGHGIVEFDFVTGVEREINAFPTPDELWARLIQCQGLDTTSTEKLLTPAYHLSGKTPRYYQEIAINRTVQAVIQGEPRVLLTMATGTGKTVVAFQICWKLWNSRWNKGGEHRRPRILYLADRNILIDDPMAKTFAPFGDARWKIAGGNAIKSREMYFATYQSIAADSNRPGLYREFPTDFFDAIVIDECHRGSSREDSNWREILNYFSSASQIGMTATPRRQDNADTYDYFGDPIFSYSLRQGIEDGFLAPYRVHRIVTTWDAVGWRPSQGDLDRFGRAIPDEEYQTTEFEKIVALKARTDAVAKHLTEFLKRTDRFAKTISPISRNALASGSRIWVLQELLILCIANILHNVMQLVLGVYASPVTADRPHPTILKNRIILSQRSRAIGLQLVSNNITAMRICGNNNMNVIRTSVGNPKMPRTNEAMFSNHRFNSGATIIIEQMNWILQSIRPPRFQQRLRWHIPFAVFSPTSECPLNMSSVGSPGNEVCQWRIVVHRSHLEHVSNYRNLV